MSRADCFDVVPAKKSREVIPMMIKDFNKREEQGFQRRAQQRIIQIDIKVLQCIMKNQDQLVCKRRWIRSKQGKQVINIRLIKNGAD